MQYNEVKELISIFEGTDLTDMEVELDNARVRLSRSGGASGWSQPAAVVTPAVQKASEAPASPEGKAAGKDSVPAKEEGAVIKAPIVGTFYQSSAPDKPPFVKVGDTVKQGDVVCIIEAMKFMNEVNSEVGGTVTEILVQDGEFVEYGQELFRLG